MTIQNSNPEGERGRLPEQPEGQVQSEHVRNDGLNLSSGHDPATCWWCHHPANHNAPLGGIPEYIGGEDCVNPINDYDMFRKVSAKDPRYSVVLENVTINSRIGGEEKRAEIVRAAMAPEFSDKRVLWWYDGAVHNGPRA